MADDKKYYWLKFGGDFFKGRKIKIIKAMDNGSEYCMFYLFLLTESLSHEGELRFSKTMPYDAKTLSIISDTNIDVVKGALEVFEQLELLQVWDDKTLYMTELGKMVGSESESAKRVRLHRAKQKMLAQQSDNKLEALQCNKNVTNVTGRVKSLELRVKSLDINTLSDKPTVGSSKIDITFMKQVKEITEYMNRVCKTNYRATSKKTQTLIKARFNEEFSVLDFKRVLDIKSSQWLNDSKMEKFLRPETLFGNKFEGYLNEKENIKQKESEHEHVETSF